MGGSGSSRWHTHTKKATVENALPFSITNLLKNYGQAAFTKGCEYPVNWTDGSAMMCYVGYVKGVLSIIPSYSYHGQERTPVIKLSETDCNYGGVRYWMHCPSCGQRCAKLYMLGGWFGCRKCHDLTYTSAQEAHRFDGLNGIFGREWKQVEELFRTEALLQKWDDRKRLTKGERRKIAEYLEIPLTDVRSRWYRPRTRARRELEHRVFVSDLLSK